MEKNEIINKSLKFIEKKIPEGYIKINSIDKEFYDIYLKEGNLCLKENLESEYKGVFIFEEKENDIYDFKKEIESAKKFLGSNSFIILRYVYPYDYIDGIQEVEEEFIKTLKLKKFIDLESYTILPKEEDDKYKLFIIARWHIDLLAENDEYEEYTSNFERKKSCCSSGGCGGCSSKNCGGCDKKKGCCSK